MAKLDLVAKDVKELKERLLEKEPEHFGSKDIIYGFFGALLAGGTFVLKGLLINVAKVITWGHVAALITSTLVLIALEVYFVGYSKVLHKKERKPVQFVLKRLLAAYLITITVAIALTAIFGIHQLVGGNWELTLKIAAIVSLPSGIGAATAAMLKKV